MCVSFTDEEVRSTVFICKDLRPVESGLKPRSISRFKKKKVILAVRQRWTFKSVPLPSLRCGLGNSFDVSELFLHLSDGQGNSSLRVL